MEVPGSEREYKDELRDSIGESFKLLDETGERFEYIFHSDESTVLFPEYTIVGVIDNRSITPESMEDCLSELKNIRKKYFNRFENLAGIHYPIVVGVTDDIKSGVRSYISDKKRLDSEGVFVVDVAAGTVLSQKRRFYHTKRPFDDIEDLLAEVID